MSKTLFKQVNYDLGALMKYIELGDIGLPDIQRPFVWPNTKIRDLFDSIYRGYPIGYLLFWESGVSGANPRSIGVDQKQKPPSLLIVDGQQRLTALYAVTRAIPIVRDTYATEEIHIAFHPLDQRFEVTDAAIRRNPEFVPDIAVLWSKDNSIFSVVEKFVQGLQAARDVAAEEIAQIQEAIMRLHQIFNFPITALSLSSAVDEEQVAEVFVRINSTGKTLNQSDFILTLMSVFWDEGRRQLEDFCRSARTPSAYGASPFNYFIAPSPDQLLRVSIGLAFRRARLQYAYLILRGKDLETGAFSDERREQQFAALMNAQVSTINLTYWHDFFKVLLQAGYKGSRMITSENNLVYSYLLYLIGRTSYNIDEFELRNIMARWFFMSNLTGRYTGGAPETMAEADLARLRGVGDRKEFVGILDRIVRDNLTDDFWNIRLPNDLATSSARSPSLSAYHAALNLLDARVLFSKMKVAELLDPAAKAPKSAVERHHLFPRNYLKGIGVTSTRDTNQIANYALVEWDDNVRISDRAPTEYLPMYASRFSSDELKLLYYWHALPEGWQFMEYSDFLERRRHLIAGIVRDGFRRLHDDLDDQATNIVTGVPFGDQRLRRTYPD